MVAPSPRSPLISCQNWRQASGSKPVVGSSRKSSPNLAGPNLAGPNLAGPNLAGPNLAGPNLAGLGLAGLGRILAEHGHRAAVPGPESLEDLHRGGLARAVRAEQGEDLAAGYLQVDAVDRRDVTVALAQVPDHDGRAVVHDLSLGGPGRAAHQPVCHGGVIRSVDVVSLRPWPGATREGPAGPGSRASTGGAVPASRAAGAPGLPRRR